MFPETSEPGAKAGLGVLLGSDDTDTPSEIRAAAQALSLRFGLSLPVASVVLSHLRGRA
jgi:hypothetical protein